MHSILETTTCDYQQPHRIYGPDPDFTLWQTCIFCFRVHRNEWNWNNAYISHVPILQATIDPLLQALVIRPTYGKLETKRVLKVLSAIINRDPDSPLCDECGGVSRGKSLYSHKVIIKRVIEATMFYGFFFFGTEQSEDRKRVRDVSFVLFRPRDTMRKIELLLMRIGFLAGRNDQHTQSSCWGVFRGAR